MSLSRRSLLSGLVALPGCTALGALNQAAEPRATYELQPVLGADRGRRNARSMLVLVPMSPAAIATDRILIKEDPLLVTYLPDARWSDDVPRMVQSVLIQSLAAPGQLGFVGGPGTGPVPDVVLSTRIDNFEVTAVADGTFQVQVSLELTVLRDRDQRLLGTRRFVQTSIIANDRTETITRSFQLLLDALLPEAVSWVLART